MSMLQMLITGAGAIICFIVILNMLLVHDKFYSAIIMAIGVTMLALPLMQQVEKYQHFIALDGQIETQGGQKNFYAQVRIIYNKEGKVDFVLLDPKTIVVEKITLESANLYGPKHGG